MALLEASCQWPEALFLHCLIGSNPLFAMSIKFFTFERAGKEATHNSQKFNKLKITSDEQQ